jgi:disulfide bond formation protein DsbB
MKRIVALLGVLVLVLAACGGGGDSDGDGADGNNPPSAGDAVAGEDIYSSTCAACHGADATGIDGLGKDLHNNAFVNGLSDDELVDFINEGRLADHPDNDTGVAMPPKGGNPSLDDDDLLDVVAYLRTLE